MFPSGPCKGDANHTARELSQHVTIRRLQHCRSPLLSVSLHISFKAKYCQYVDFFHICQTCNAFFHLKAIFLGFCWVCHFLRILSGFFWFDNYLLRSLCDHLFPCNPVYGPPHHLLHVQHLLLKEKKHAHK